jgi:hypothetical protein
VSAGQSPALGSINCPKCGTLLDFYDLTEKPDWSSVVFVSEELEHCGDRFAARIYVGPRRHPRGGLTEAGKEVVSR